MIWISEENEEDSEFASGKHQQGSGGDVPTPESVYAPSKQIYETPVPIADIKEDVYTVNLL